MVVVHALPLEHINTAHIHTNAQIQEEGSATIKKMVKNSELNTPLMLWVIAYCMSTGFTSPPASLLTMLRRIFGSWIQSRVCEKGNKVLRDAETRSNMSKA